MKKLSTLFIITALFTLPLSAYPRDDMTRNQEARNELYRADKCGSDGGMTQIGTSMIGWGFGIGLAIAILAASIHQSTEKPPELYCCPPDAQNGAGCACKR